MTPGAPRARFSILTMMKDEGPRLLEWLAYHRLIGFDAVWIYSNDCRDGSDAMLDRLGEMGLCRHLRNPVPPDKKPQPNALRLAERNPEILATEWLMVADADEFVHIKPGHGRLPDLVAACPAGCDGVAITWRSMGSSGKIDWSSDPVLTQFTHGAPDGFRSGWGVKTLFRPFANLKLGIHRPYVRGAKQHPERLETLLSRQWVNGSGRPMPPSFKAKGWRSSAATLGYDLAEVAHFAVQSHEAYLLRGDRGNVNLKQGKYDATYFAVFDRNENHLPALSRWSDMVAALVADWRQDRTLDALADASIAWHRQRLDELRGTPEFTTRSAALRRAAAVPYTALDQLLFEQPLPPGYRRMLAEKRGMGVPDAALAAMVARAVARQEALRDAREAAELRAMGVTPANG
jgi:hypothetical protein